MRRCGQHEISSYLDLASGYGHIYAVDEADHVVAIDQQTSEVVWRQEGLQRRKLSSPAAFSNYLVVDDEGYVHVLAQSDGRFLARRKLDGKGIRSGMAVADGRTLYVLTNSGALHALEIETR